MAEVNVEKKIISRILDFYEEQCICKNIQLIQNKNANILNSIYEQIAITSGKSILKWFESPHERSEIWLNYILSMYANYLYTKQIKPPKSTIIWSGDRPCGNIMWTCVKIGILMEGQYKCAVSANVSLIKKYNRALSLREPQFEKGWQMGSFPKLWIWPKQGQPFGGQDVVDKSGQRRVWKESERHSNPTTPKKAENIRIFFFESHH